MQAYTLLNDTIYFKLHVSFNFKFSMKYRFKINEKS